MILLLVACQRETGLPEATSAAKEVYLQYANRKDLTVAMIGDYQGYNAVMLQAQDAEGWLRLCEEFGVKVDVDAEVLDSTRVTSLMRSSYSADSHSFSGTNLDSLRTSMGEFITHLLDSVVESQRGLGLWDTAYTVKHSERWENGTLVNRSIDTLAGVAPPPSRLLDMAVDHGHHGFLIHDDSDDLSLWLFFYTTQKELSQIINNITSKYIQQ